MKKNIILMGPPASGKGTIAKKLKNELHLAHISTGDMFREAMSEGSEMGLKAKSYIEAGHLVPDEVTIEVVKERFNKGDLHDGYLLDGFPRTIEQADALKSFTSSTPLEVEAVINLDCEEEELIRRISGRRVCKDCGAPYHIETMKPKKEGVCDLCGGELKQRSDDNEEALKTRLVHYYESTQPLLDYYDQLGLLKTFKSQVEADALYEQILKYLTM